MGTDSEGQGGRGGRRARTKRLKERAHEGMAWMREDERRGHRKQRTLGRDVTETGIGGSGAEGDGRRLMRRQRTAQAKHRCTARTLCGGADPGRARPLLPGRALLALAGRAFGALGGLALPGTSSLPRAAAGACRDASGRRSLSGPLCRERSGLCLLLGSAEAWAGIAWCRSRAGEVGDGAGKVGEDSEGIL